MSKTTKDMLIKEKAELTASLKLSDKMLVDVTRDSNEKEELILKLSTRLTAVVDQLAEALKEV